MSNSNMKHNPKKGVALNYYYRPDSPTFNSVSRTARHVKCGVNTLAKWLRSEEADEVQRQIAAENRIGSPISVRQIQEKLIEIAEAANKAGQFHASISAYATLLKTIGGFIADLQPEANLIGKALDAKRAEDLRAIADRYFIEKYLAIPASKPIEATSRPTETCRQTVEQIGTGQRNSQEGGYLPPSLPSCSYPPLP